MHDDFLKNIHEIIDRAVIRITLEQVGIEVNSLDDLDSINSISKTKHISPKEAYELFEKQKAYKQEFNNLIND